MSGIYRTGTVATSNSSKVVTGTGTAWLANVKPGDLFIAVGSNGQGIVDTVDSDTQITLFDNFATTLSGVAYTIVQTAHEWNPIVPFAEDVADLITDLGGLAGHIDDTDNPHVTTFLQSLVAQGLTPSEGKIAKIASGPSAALIALTSFGESLLASAGVVPEKPSTDVASGSITTGLPAALLTTNYVRITGTSGISGLGNIPAGIRFKLRFASTPLLTHSSSLILPGSVNFQAAAGDVLEFLAEGSSVARCVGGLLATGKAFVGLTGTDVTFEAGAISPTVGMSGAGTFTASVVGAQSDGAYIALADLVVFWIKIQFNVTTNSAAGQLEIGGLPDAAADNNVAVSVGRWAKFKLSAVERQIGAYIVGDKIRLAAMKSAATPANVGKNHVIAGNGYSLFLSGSYIR